MSVSNIKNALDNVGATVSPFVTEHPNVVIVGGLALTYAFAYQQGKAKGLELIVSNISRATE